MSRQLLVTLYVLFAIISIAINMSAQFLTTVVYQGLYYIEISIFTGTIVGLPPRYILDKRYIFHYQTVDFSEDGRLFVLYTFMSVLTTIIFWSTEYVFHYLFEQDYMRYVGGVIGLTVGFVIKYQLDKKFVFAHSSKETSAS